MTDIYNTIENKATYHTIICCSFCGLYTLFILLFIQRLFKFTSFEQTMEQTYILKGMSSFMVLSMTVLNIPIIASILIIIKGLAIGLITGKLFYASLICSAVLAIEFSVVLVYSLKFFNLEVPNDDVPWSHNQTNGLYFKIILKMILCS